jgi:hypothetical protein
MNMMNTYPPPGYHGDPRDYLRELSSWLRDHFGLHEGLAAEYALEALNRERNVRAWDED